MDASQRILNAEVRLCLILADPESMETGEWLHAAVSDALIPPLQRALLLPVGPQTEESAYRRYLFAGLSAFRKPAGDVEQSASGFVSVPPNKTVCLIVGIFWDGQTEVAKSEFFHLRKILDELPAVHFIFQAVNAKKGTHTLRENRIALISSLRKKIPDPPAASATHVDPLGDVPREGSKENEPSFGVEDLSEAAMAAAIAAGQGECFILIAAENTEAFGQRVAQLFESVEKNNAKCMPVLTEPREVTKELNGEKKKFIAQEFLLRQGIAQTHIEMRIAMCGNVDSGKSTLTSVLTRGCRDDGRGSARAFVFNHRHELRTGRTSSVSENHIGLSPTGEVVNYTIDFTHGKAQSAYLLEQVVSKSAKVITLYDLAGHERYLKTTIFGITHNSPDYVCVVISANNGIQRMTKEHISLCLAFKIPFFVVLTRIDSTPDNVRQETLSNIHKLLKNSSVRKLPYPIRRVDDIVVSAKNLHNDRITPIFEVSNVTGKGLEDLLRFINLLPLRKDWRDAREKPREMVIDNIFIVPGVGTVVGGIVTQGTFCTNDTVLLGPDVFGAYRPVTIKSIHVKGVEEFRAVAGCDAAFCLKKERRSAIRKGSILADPLHPPLAFWQFEADVTILYHSTTISRNYEPVIQSATVRQSARIVFVAQDVLRTGDRSLVRFHFLYRPEFMKIGQQLIFREGRTKGIGVISKVIVNSDKALLRKLKHEKHLKNYS